MRQKAIITLFLITLCVYPVYSQDTRRVTSGGTTQRGFSVDYEVIGYRESVYDSYSYYLQGKVANNYHRTVSSIIVYIQANGSGGNANDIYAIYLYNLGPQESGQFSKRIWNWDSLRIVKIEFTLSDGSKEEVRL